jgi:hypothetical protein
LIYWVRGREASYALLPAEPATDTTVVAIVDSVHLKSVAAPERPAPAAPTPAPAGRGRKASRKASSC